MTFFGFGCPKRHPDALLARTMMVSLLNLICTYEIIKVLKSAFLYQKELSDKCIDNTKSKLMDIFEENIYILSVFLLLYLGLTVVVFGNFQLFRTHMDYMERTKILVGASNFGDGGSAPGKGKWVLTSRVSIVRCFSSISLQAELYEQNVNSSSRFLVCRLFVQRCPLVLNWELNFWPACSLMSFNFSFWGYFLLQGLFSDKLVINKACDTFC